MVWFWFKASSVQPEPEPEPSSKTLHKAQVARDTSIERYHNKIRDLQESLVLAEREVNEAYRENGSLRRANSTLELNLNKEHEVNKQLCQEIQASEKRQQELRKCADSVRSLLKRANYELEILKIDKYRKGHRWITAVQSNCLLSQQRDWFQATRDQDKSGYAKLQAQKNRTLWRLTTSLSKLALQNDQLKLRVKELNKAFQTKFEPGIELAVAREKLSGARQKIRVLEAEKLALLAMDKKATDLEFSLRQELGQEKTRASRLEGAWKDAAWLLDGDWRYVDKQSLRGILKPLLK
ncbi:uncharacterized protein MYCFIDRAFT_173215 [Pseudocercospora fijiensis CIRAD86]|uniref:Uncharacterized protein n=1 Tax=Pseudocercospora fijiensis (strain CIRAD86) TaxID=383855 RepID=M3AHV7_PSEFD|nr:uncharacterized protein MYCFIDRAFT_173215 [Pseudocercospora fijiensis CIRAD86]EME84176.1 hypothetical protein MYCFIDRAFT_173215 [Pseudocercospora fijiensis CIRAD86]